MNKLTLSDLIIEILRNKNYVFSKNQEMTFLSFIIQSNELKNILNMEIPKMRIKHTEALKK